MTAVLLPNGKQQYFTTAGLPAVGYKIATFDAGTSNPRTTWLDAGKVSANANPVILDGRGEASIFWDGAYKVQLQDSTGAVIWTQDNLQSQQNSLSTTLVPATNNTVDLGSVTLAWRNLYLGANNAAILDTVSGNVGYYARTVAEIAAVVTPTNFVYPEGDIRRYGALVAATDNSTAINSALAVSSAGGAAAYIPGGTWKITSTLACIGLSCMYGAGQASIIAPQNCDGLTFSAQPDLTTRFFRSFAIIGATTGTRNGIIINLTAASGQTVSGTEFHNLDIQNFGQAVFCRGLWESTFLDCRLYNNYQGYYFHGQNIVDHIIGGFIQRGTITGTGTAYGVLADVISGETTQSLHLTDTACYAYDVNVSWSTVLYGTITNCDLSVCTQVGIQLATCRGGIFIQNNWVQTNNASFATVGIQVLGVGTAIDDKVLINGNQVICQLANAGSIGVDIQTLNTGVTTTNNTVGSGFAGTQFAIGIKNTGAAHNHIIKWNTIAASTTAISASSLSTDMEIGPNVIVSGTPLVFNALTPAGLSYYARGTFTLTLSAGASGASGTVNYVADGKIIALTVAAAGITGTGVGTTLTGSGLPQVLWPVTNQSSKVNTIDAGTGQIAFCTIAAATGVISFSKNANGDAMVAGGLRGVNGDTLTYAYA